MMRKMNLYKAAMCAAAIMMFTSCLDGGSNIVRNYALGVVRLDMKTMKNVLDISDNDYPFYSPVFSVMNEGVCCQVQYLLDWGLAENSQAVLTSNGYYTVTIEEKLEVDRYPLSGLLTDTLKALTNEFPVVNPLININGYIKGLLFMSHQLKQPTDQQTGWELSYDSQNPVKDENGQRVYDLYLRAFVKAPGSKSAEDMAVMNAYEMGNYLKMIAQNEKNLNHQQFYLRFNYVSEIKEDQLTWKRSDNRAVQVTDILPETSY
jgi:hypothetical protein